MFDFERTRKHTEFVQEHAYVEDYSLFYEPPKKKKERDENPRGVVEIDLDNGKTIQIT